MNRHRPLKIACRIDALLMRDLGQGIDAWRMASEPVYARDVLLVCESFQNGELALLARQFRAAIAAVTEEAAGPQSSGFSASRFLTSIFGPLSTHDAPRELRPSKSRDRDGRPSEGGK